MQFPAGWESKHTALIIVVMAIGAAQALESAVPSYGPILRVLVSGLAAGAGYLGTTSGKVGAPSDGLD